MGGSLLVKLSDKLFSLTLYGVITWLSYQLVIAPNGVRLLVQLKQLEVQQQDVLAKIKQEESVLMHKKQALQQDPMYLEFEARKDWAFVKPTEKRIFLLGFRNSE